MEITCANFKSVYSDIEQFIENASYVAVDVEFLGLDVEESSSKCSLFDSPEERYTKLRQSIIRFPPVQLGLAFFTETFDASRYDVHPYNIYLYKQGVQKQDFDFAVSSLQFLKNHGFDFNSFVTRGVSYLNLDELEEVMNRLLNFYDGLESFGPTMRESVNRVQQTLYHRLARYRRKSTGSEGAPNRYFEPFFVNIDRESLTDLQKAVLLYKLYCCTPGVRMRLHENYIECDSSRLTKRELIEIKQGLLGRIRRELMGVSEIIMAVIDKRLPLIGHNGMHDLMYLYHSFVANLPADYKQFKREITSVFPVYIDTKHLAEECTHKLSWFGVMSYRLETLGCFFGSNLSDACAPNIEFSNAHPLAKRQGGQCQTHYHNAGYDATTTGKIFIRLVHLVAKPLHSFDCGPIHPLGLLMDVVSHLSCRVPVPLLGIPFVHLLGEDPPSRKPGEIALTLQEDASIETLKKELKEQFGTWRCDIKFQDSIVRVASNTETTSRRVYNFLLSRSCYNVLEVSPSPPSSYSTPYRSPSPRKDASESTDSLSSVGLNPPIPLDMDFTLDSIFDWVHILGSLFLNLHIKANRSKLLF